MRTWMIVIGLVFVVGLIVLVLSYEAEKDVIHHASA
jgi:hypothetical protein